MLLLIIYVVVALGFSFLCSIAEAVLLSITSAHIALLEKEKKPAGKLLRQLKDDVNKPLAAILTLNTIAHTIVDWRPFDYYSTDLLINGQINCRHTIALQPVADGTQVSFVSQAPTSEKFIPKLIIKLMGNKLRRKIEADFSNKKYHKRFYRST